MCPTPPHHQRLLLSSLPLRPIPNTPPRSPPHRHRPFCLRRGPMCVRDGMVAPHRRVLWHSGRIYILAYILAYTRLFIDR